MLFAVLIWGGKIMHTWKMPEWMKQYTTLICSDQKQIEKLVNNEIPLKEDPGVALVSREIQAKVRLLKTLHDLDLLKDYDPDRIC